MNKHAGILSQLIISFHKYQDLQKCKTVSSDPQLSLFKKKGLEGKSIKNTDLLTLIPLK